jgi:hypothetical protein
LVLFLLHITPFMHRSTYIPRKHRVRIKAKAMGPVLMGMLTAVIGFLAGMSFPVAFTTKVNNIWYLFGVEYMFPTVSSLIS